MEAAELQRLPPTAMIVSYGTATGRHVVLADANPAIGGLGVATLTALSDISELTAADAGMPMGGAGVRPADRPETALNPNLGPPPSRPDWRRGARS